MNDCFIIMAHITMYARRYHCVRTWWEGPTGAGARRMVACDMTHYEPRTRPPRWVLTYYDYDNSCDATFISIRKSIEMLK